MCVCVLTALYLTVGNDDFGNIDDTMEETLIDLEICELKYEKLYYS